MKALILLCSALLFFIHPLGFSQEKAGEIKVTDLVSEIINSKKKEPKVLVLIIASSGTQAYLELQKVWESYMHTDPEHFEVYFIRGNPELASSSEIKENSLFVMSEESFVPGILKKTVLSMEAMLPRLHEFDYVLRTNLSSFYVFPRLLNFLKTLPPHRCYCGVQLHTPTPHPQLGMINYISGAGIILSTDLVEMLVHGKEEVFKTSHLLADDELLGLFFQRRGVFTLPAARTDFPTREVWDKTKDQIAENAFHFRAKNNYNIRTAEESFADEIFIDLELLKKFYPASSSS